MVFVRFLWRVKTSFDLSMAGWGVPQGVGKVGGWWRLGRFDGALTGWCVVETGARAPQGR